MRFNDLRKLLGLPPFPVLAISLPCDFNLKTAEKVPNALALRGDSVSALEFSFVNSDGSHEGSTQTKPWTHDQKDFHVFSYAAHDLESIIFMY